MASFFFVSWNKISIYFMKNMALSLALQLLKEPGLKWL